MSRQNKIANAETISDIVITEDAYIHITHPKKRAMLNALVHTLGIVTTACQSCNIHRRTHYDWMSNDAEYKKAVQEIDNVVLDVAETQLYKKIREGDTIATIFYLKTKGKKRGYIERHELTGADGKELKAFSWDDLYNVKSANALNSGTSVQNNGEDSSAQITQ